MMRLIGLTMLIVITTAIAMPRTMPETATTIMMTFVRAVALSIRSFKDV